MEPHSRLAQLNREADELMTKADTEPDSFTHSDAARAKAVASGSRDLRKMLDRQEKAAVALHAAGAGTPYYDGEGTPDSEPIGGGGMTVRSKPGQLGQAEKTAHFTSNVMKSFEQAAPTVGGPSVQKALIPSGAIAAPFDGRIVTDPKAAFSLLEAVNSREVSTPTGTYLRQTLRENNADAVVNGDLKPVSRYGLEPATWEISTIAHLTEPVQMQWLEDYGSLLQFIGSEMGYGLDEAVADYILNGNVSEEGNTIPGILNTTGIPQTAHNVNEMLTVRSALGELETAGVDATTIVLNPSDWETIETTRDTQENFLLPLTPTQQATRTLWGTPVTLVPGMPAGQAVVGDLSTVSLLYRSSMQILWFQSGATNIGTEAAPVMTDLVRKNQGVFRGELRVGLEILSTKSLRIADLTAV